MARAPTTIHAASGESSASPVGSQVSVYVPSDEPDPEHTSEPPVAMNTNTKNTRPSPGSTNVPRSCSPDVHSGDIQSRIQPATSANGSRMTPPKEMKTGSRSGAAPSSATTAAGTQSRCGNGT